jgi:uncharacterized protein (UPF0210 family)
MFQNSNQTVGLQKIISTKQHANHHTNEAKNRTGPSGHGLGSFVTCTTIYFSSQCIRGLFASGPRSMQADDLLDSNHREAFKIRRIGI